MTVTVPPAFSPRASIEDYRVEIEWPPEIAGLGLLGSSWSSAPEGLELSAEAIAGGVTSVRVAGGTPRTRYVLRNVVQAPGEGGTDTYAVSVPLDCAW